MKPVHCSKIAVEDLEGSAWHRKGCVGFGWCSSLCFLLLNVNVSWALEEDGLFSNGCCGGRQRQVQTLIPT
jgi:hypothetical protein